MDGEAGTAVAGTRQDAGSGPKVLGAVLGLVLLGAAALKTYELAFEPMSEDSFLASPRLAFALVEGEILLGVWLLSGWARRAAWVAAGGFFGTAAGVSLYLALAGQPSCGCFGRLTVSPRLTFTLDLMAVAALALRRPARSSTREHSPPWLRGVMHSVGGTGLVLAVLGGAFLLIVDDPAAVLARLRGEVITVDPGVSQVGEEVSGTRREFRIQLKNHGQRPVYIMGGTTTCACVATRDLPVVVPPGESRTIQVQVAFRGKPGHFQHSFLLYTDNEKQPVVTARFAGRVMEPASP